jgi:hypothetical protein
LEQVLEAPLVMRGEEGQYGTRARFVRVAQQRVCDVGDEAKVGLPQHPSKLRGDGQLGISDARVVERPPDQRLDEALRERRVRRALRASQHDHDRRAVLEAVVEELFGEGMVAGVVREALHVLRRAERADAGPCPALELSHELVRHHRAKERLLVRKVAVQIANGGAGALRDRSHTSAFVAALRKRRPRRGHERVPNMVFGRLTHQKRM